MPMLPVRQAAALLRCSDKRLWRRIEHYVSAARALDDMCDVGIVGIHETSLRKGQNYITVVHDLGPQAQAAVCLRGVKWGQLESSMLLALSD